MSISLLHRCLASPSPQACWSTRAGILAYAIHVSSYLLYMCPHTCSIRVLIPSICVSSYLKVWKHWQTIYAAWDPPISATTYATIYVFGSVRIPALHATIYVFGSVRIPALHATIYVSSVFAYLLYMRLYMCPQCSHTCFTCDYIFILILTIHVQERAEICFPSSCVCMQIHVCIPIHLCIYIYNI
jgi:hypothetical protein